MKKKNLSSQAGFTLVELLVVIAIISTLAAISLVAFNALFRDSADKVTNTRINRIDQAIQKLLADGETLPDFDGTENSSIELYKLLFNDADANGSPDGIKVNQTYLPELQASDANGVRNALERWVDDQYRIVDANGKPLRIFRDGSNINSQKNNFQNGYDLWSLGQEDGDDTDDINNW